MAQDHDARRRREEAPHRHEGLPVEGVGNDQAHEHDRPEDDHGAPRRQQERQAGRREIGEPDGVGLAIVRPIDDVAVEKRRGTGMAQDPPQQIEGDRRAKADADGHRKPAPPVRFDQPDGDRRIERPEGFREEQEQERQDRHRGAAGRQWQIEPQQALHALLEGEEQRRGRERQLARLAHPRERRNAEDAGDPGRDETRGGREAHRSMVAFRGSLAGVAFRLSVVRARLTEAAPFLPRSRGGSPAERLAAAAAAWHDACCWRVSSKGEVA